MIIYVWLYVWFENKNKMPRMDLNYHLNNNVNEPFEMYVSNGMQEILKPIENTDNHSLYFNSKQEHKRLTYQQFDKEGLFVTKIKFK